MILSTLKTSELSFCSKFKIYFLMVPNLELAFKIIRPIIFPAIKKISFPQSRNFSTIKEIFHSQGTFPKSKKLFHSQGTFPQSCGKLPLENFMWKTSCGKLPNFSTILHNQRASPQS